MSHLPAISEYPERLRFRFCPRCAAPLEPRPQAGPPRLVCPSDGWTHYPTPNLAATVLVEHGDGVVLLRRAIPPDVGIWHMPIGHLEFGEAPHDAARREVAEETGLTIDEPVLLDYDHTPAIGDPLDYYIVFCFRARSAGGMLRIDAESSSARVFAPDSLPALAWSSQRRTLAAWRAWKAGQPLAETYL